MSNDKKEPLDGFDKPLARDSKAEAIGKVKAKAKEKEEVVPLVALGVGFTPEQLKLAEYLDGITNKRRYKTTEASEKVVKLEAAIAAMTDLNASTRSQIQAVFSVALGIPLDWAANDRRANLSGASGKGTMVIPISGRGGHNYTIGKPTMIVEAGTTAANAIRLDGMVGNTLYTSPADIRIATTEEVYDFVAVCPITAICDALRIVLI